MNFPLHIAIAASISMLLIGQGCVSYPDKAQDAAGKLAEETTAKPEKKTKIPVKLIPPDQETSPFLTNDSFITDWHVLGPFKFTETDFGGGMQNNSIDKEFVTGEEELDPSYAAPKGSEWKSIIAPGARNAGEVDFDSIYGNIDYSTAYAVTFIDMPCDMDGISLRVGSDDYVKVWINGKIILTYNKECRASDWDQNIVKGITLKKGLNRIVVKCVDIVDGWSMYVRLTGRDGLPFRTEK